MGKKLILMKNSLKNLNTFAISNNPHLSFLYIERGTYYNDTYIESVCSFVKSVEISSIF